MGLEDRVQRLEAKPPTNPEWVVPIEVRILTKAVARHHALEDGWEPPSYSQEELEQMYQDDLEVVSGRGVVGQMKVSSGWCSEEGRRLLNTWETDARRRLARTEELGEHWAAAYENDEQNDDYEKEEDEPWMNG